MNRILYLIIGLLLLLLGVSALYVAILHGKVKLTGQYKALYESTFMVPETWQAKDSTWHSKTETVVVSDPKVVAEISALTGQVEGLKNNMKNFVSYNKVGTETTIKKTVVVKDSIFVYTTKRDTIRGRLVGDSIQLEGVTHTVLDVVTYWDRKWFLGKKKEWTEVTSDNPDTKIIINRSIKKERKKGLFN
jgi:hypothetical protein